MPLQEQFDELQQDYISEPYLPIKIRREALQQLKAMLQHQSIVLSEAISQDFSHRSDSETLFLEIFPTIKAINYCLKHLKQWTRKRKKRVPLYFLPASAYLIPQALGVVGIIVPWNYPIFLSIIPLAYALAAGNRVMIKMSELTPYTTSCLQELLEKYPILSQLIKVIDGDIELAKSFSRLAFGHLLFTGSTTVGKSVMMAASEHLTPITLELGGKSPAIISHTVNENYLRRLFMGKLFNAGQTCIAPDYLMIPVGFEAKIEQLFLAFMQDHYPNLDRNNDYTHMISEHHKQRILAFIEDASSKGAKVIAVGSYCETDRKMPVYLLFHVNHNMRVMQEEIFGPILPILIYESFDAALGHVNTMPNPLAIYYFGQDQQEINKLATQTLSGALTINDTLMHVAINNLPFGGVAQSGMGHYHGQEGFDTFSKLKPVLIQGKFAPVSWFYPPYGRFMRFVLRLIAGIR